jgi:hypothetical protein
VRYGEYDQLREGTKGGQGRFFSGEGERVQPFFQPEEKHIDILGNLGFRKCQNAQKSQKTSLLGRVKVF